MNKEQIWRYTVIIQAASAGTVQHGVGARSRIPSPESERRGLGSAPLRLRAALFRSGTNEWTNSRRSCDKKLAVSFLFFLFFAPKFNFSHSGLQPFLGSFVLSPPPLHRPVSQSTARRRHLLRQRSHQDPPLLKFHQLLLAA